MSSAPKVPKAPPAPDPRIAIAADARANRFDVRGPHGTVTWSGDPLTGMTQTTKLTPTEQRQLNYRNQIAERMFQGAGRRVGAVSGSNFSFDRDGHRAAQAEFDRQRALLDPVRKVQEDQFDQKMANMGLPMGSDAQSEARREFDQNWNTQYTDAARAAELTGADLALKSRNQNYNEIAAALGNQQVEPQGGGGGPLDVQGAYARQQAAQNQAYQGQMAAYNQGIASNNSMMGGLMGLGGQLGAAYLLASDRRLKHGIVSLNKLWNGLKVYAFSYLGSLTRHVGVMSDEVRELFPHAVISSPSGYDWVNYGAIA